MNAINMSRRRLLRGAGCAGIVAAAALGGCSGRTEEAEVTANEDLMREHAYEEMGDRFEDIEKRTFGHDGFDDALGRIARTETAFGLADLAALTAPAPPAG